MSSTDDLSPALSGEPMPEPSRQLRRLGLYYAVAQVGMEMVVPAGLGALLDSYAGTGPWGVIGGAVFGLVAGVAHLVVLADRLARGNAAGEDKEPNTR